MSETVIKVEDLSKLYRLGEVGTGSLAHDVNRWWHRARGKEDPYSKVGQVNDRSRKAESEWVWALKDINFEVKRGEVLGIIGRNGAGKSTLLKILSRVTAPTSGEIRVKGRIASLLEVGTGFHPELTGRENIYLNGAILGMRKKEIDGKLDEIVDFSGCEAYLDTPVKRYSSGMQVRLAFAVAAHLNPEILVVDEVLAVGDAEFQKKCLGKLREASSQQGRTVLFVSHNQGAIANLCSRCVLVEAGEKLFDGVPQDALRQYKELTRGAAADGQGLSLTQRTITGPVKLLDLRLPQENRTWDPFVATMTYCNTSDQEVSFEFALSFKSVEGGPILQFYSNQSGVVFRCPPGRGVVELRDHCLPLAPGSYYCNAWIGLGNAAYDFCPDCMRIDVAAHVIEGGSFVPRRVYYPTLMPCDWSHNHHGNSITDNNTDTGSPAASKVANDCHPVAGTSHRSR